MRDEDFKARDLAVLMRAYKKHHLMESDPDTGWAELSTLLADRICEHIGDDAFCEWVDSWSR